MKIEFLKNLIDVKRLKFFVPFSIAAGMAAVFGLPPYYMFPVFAVTVFLFMRLLDALDSKKSAALAGFCFGFGYFSLGLAWISNAIFGFAPELSALTPLIFIGCGIWGGAYIALATFVSSFYPKGAARHIAFASAWILAEYLRSHLFTGFAWNLTATVWADNLPMMQVLSVGGSYALGLVTMLFIALLATLPDVTRKDIPKAVAALIVFVAIYAAGEIRIRQNPTEYTDISLRLIQPNIPPSLHGDDKKAKQEFWTGIEMSLKDLPADTDYILWAETAMPYRMYGLQGALNRIGTALPEEIPLITGALRYAGADVYNSALVIKGGEITDYYDKSHLVPFGEYVPLHSVFPFMEKFTAGGADLAAGSGVKAMNIGKGGEVGILICYEVIFPDDVHFTYERPKWLLNLTNDSWYGESSGPYQHFAATKLRAVEQGLPLIRVSGGGISGLVTALGEVPVSLELNTVGMLDVMLPKPLPPTLYSKTGSWPTLLLCMLVLLFVPVKRIFKKS